MTTRTTLRRDLTDLKQKVYLLGEKCIEISDLYNSLLESYSSSLEARLNELIVEIKTESKQLHDQCFLVLTLQQPLIKDLRFVIGSLQVILNLEKIADFYNSIISLTIDVNILESKIKNDLLKMANYNQELLKVSLTLYLSSNLDLCENISKIFSEISYLHDFLYKSILGELAMESGKKVQIEAQVLTTIRAIEKISDLIFNISEQVKYIIIGKFESQNPTSNK